MRIRSRSFMSFLALGLLAIATEAGAQNGPPPEFEKNYKITGLGRNALAAELQRYGEVVAVAREMRLLPQAMYYSYGR